ncbi:phytanoyl-CoA dioxygenase family protein [Mameliella sediminis]|uniref:phytanoyl-CoA dioxygenase family protein n=1 Tax=Mameliella sediminis TaxID=2836866 RepID=UPI001C46FB8A|nr:phytanoyl-CoA dioxygenase family protein [Mameliella sediminis]MBV7393961.1 phytanoyl-CoA dioxygenase family protein [Mameliella sediminis]MBY6162125.1 phytanoyl-CoA dioxygenase family protein [Mameliella alba]MBY6170595.1 phytanoyl-CoA dioxygenase family protein [Mameliella alba]MBY6175613.1 phytanoyl-CoA dioxygenase family protein [Mameliella alba]
MLSQTQKEFYDQNGYLKVEQVVTPEELAELQSVTEALINQSREVSQSDERFDLDKGHTPDQPRLTRIKLPHKQHPVYDRILKHSGVTRVLNDLLGPDTVLNTAKLNCKAPGGGAAVEWHQDWAFYPATNDTLLAVGLMLEDVTEENGPLLVIPGTHKGPVLSHHANGTFCGAINPEDPLFEKDKIVTLTGKAGDMTVHHVRMLHGSAPNVSERARKILFYECAAADAWPLLGASSYIHSLGQRRFWDDLQDRLITGQLALEPRLAQVPVRMPLPPAVDNSSIFKTQQSGGAKSAFA